jgi:hypothetical protein
VLLRLELGRFPLAVLAIVHRELSVDLVKGNHAIFRAGMHLHTRASGHARIPGCVVPTAEIE